MMKNRPIILASSSPRRKELLAGLGLHFITHSSEVDETVRTDISPEQIVEQLSLRKAKAVAPCYNEGIVIGSDTIVVLNGQVLGKPKDQQDAYHMLQALQGRTHFVYTGIAVINLETNETLVSSEHTEVDIRPLTDEEIYNYIATGEPMDKAGAYAIQGLGATLVTSIRGDFFTVVGLPLQRLSEMLRHFGVDVLQLQKR